MAEISGRYCFISPDEISYASLPIGLTENLAIPVRFTTDNSGAELDTFAFAITPDESEWGYSVDAIMYGQNGKTNAVFVDGQWIGEGYDTIDFGPEPQIVPLYFREWVTTYADPSRK